MDMLWNLNVLWTGAQNASFISLSSPGRKATFETNYAGAHTFFSFRYLRKEGLSLPLPFELDAGPRNRE